MSALPIDLHLAWRACPPWRAVCSTNVLLTFITLAIGLFTSLLVTLARMSKNRLVSGLAGALCGVLPRRAAADPALSRLLRVRADYRRFATAPCGSSSAARSLARLSALVLNHTAFMVEVVRGALEAVPAGLIEASKALGISPRQTFLRIRLPLAMRYGLKAYQNEVVMFAKGTAVVSTITVIDLTAVANGIFETTYDPFTPILTAAALYWIFVNTLRLGFREDRPVSQPASDRDETSARQAVRHASGTTWCRVRRLCRRRSAYRRRGSIAA